MHRFVKLFETLDQTFSTLEKIQILEDYFQEAEAADAAWALYFLMGKRLKRIVGPKILCDWCIEETNIPEWLFYECYGAVGDGAEVIALLASGRKSSIDQIPLSTWMEERILPLKNLVKEEQKSLISGWWKRLNVSECLVLNKILTGAFRVGVSHLLTIKGLSKALGVRVELVTERLMGDWQPSEQFFLSLQVKTQRKGIDQIHPYPFYLASPLDRELEVLGDPQEWLAEWKWDGIRAQIIKREGQIAIWSRGMEIITDQFPEIVEAARELPDCVIDGEILAFQGEFPLLFAELQKRLGRKKLSPKMLEEVPVILMAYDLLEIQEKDIRKESLSTRRKMLENLLKDSERIKISPAVEFNSWSELPALRTSARERFTEGLMLKRKGSPYEIGRRKGAWWKFKTDPMTIDAILIYANPGSGRRASLYTDYTFGVWNEKGEIIPAVKAYSGLSQEEIDELDKWIRRNTEEKFGPARKVKPIHVFEIAFEGIQYSNRHKSGVALRFPRILRWRRDKPASEADTLENLKKFLS